MKKILIAVLLWAGKRVYIINLAALVKLNTELFALALLLY